MTPSAPTAIAARLTYLSAPDSLQGALAAGLMVQYEWHFVPATLVCLAVGALIGAAQGWFVAYFHIPSFIVTLAGMLVFKGLALALLNGQSVGPFPDTFQALSSGFIPDPLAGAELRLTSLLLGAAVALTMVALDQNSSMINMMKDANKIEIGQAVEKIFSQPNKPILGRPTRQDVRNERGDMDRNGVEGAASDPTDGSDGGGSPAG